MTTGTLRATAEARAIAKDAYIFTYSLALQYRTMYVQAIDAKSKEYVGEWRAPASERVK